MASELERKLELLEARFTQPSTPTSNSAPTRTFEQLDPPFSSRSGHGTVATPGLSLVQQATEKHLSKVRAAAAAESNSSSATQVIGNATKRRKSVPVKRAHPTVRDRHRLFGGTENVVNAATGTPKKRKARSTASKTESNKNKKIQPKLKQKKPQTKPPEKSPTVQGVATTEVPMIATPPSVAPEDDVNNSSTIDWRARFVQTQKTLQQQLQTVRAELRSAHEAGEQRQAAVREKLETQVRETALSKAVTVLRERAASAVGRLVTQRQGLRAVEVWEEGPEWMAWQEAYRQNKSKIVASHERLRIAHEEATAFEAGNGPSTATALDVNEAVESARWHVGNHLKQQKLLKEQEARLNKEKVAHIRALRRVAAEDNSRFRDRPTLNNRYVLQELLGKGGFSEVWEAFDLDELSPVAVKIHQLDPRWSEPKKENYTKHVAREYEIHRRVRHPRIVSLHDVFEIDNNSFATVLEICSGRDLDLLLKERRRLPERDARAILLQILSGMRYLSQSDGERQGIIHYDLKPGNILFDENGDAKITDFGLSKIVDSLDTAESMELTSQGAGTYWYLPPECFVTDDDHTVRISNKVDVWSIGVIFYQMLFGKRPFGDGQSQDKILADQTMLSAHTVEFPTSVSVTDECKRFIGCCLTYEQEFRPSIAQICEDPYVTQSVLDGPSSPT